MQCTSLIATGKLSESLLIYSIPIGLLTEGILHANNARDIKSDTLAGAKTLASIIGFENSYYFYISLFIGAYASAIYISLFLNWGCIGTLLTVPLALELVKRFREKNMVGIDGETAKMHLPFGVLIFIGVQFTQQGFLAPTSIF